VSLAAALAAKATGGSGREAPPTVKASEAAATAPCSAPRSPVKGSASAPPAPQLHGDNHRGEELESGLRSMDRSPKRPSPLEEAARSSAESGETAGELSGSSYAKEEAYRAVSRLAAHQDRTANRAVDSKPTTRLKGGRRAGFEPAWPDKLKGNATNLSRAGPQLKGNFNPPRRLSRGLTSKFIADKIYEIRGGSPTRKKPDRMQRTLQSTASSTPGSVSAKGRSPVPGYHKADLSDGGSTTQASNWEFSRDPSSSQESEMQGQPTPGSGTPTGAVGPGSLLRSSPLSRQGQQSRLSRGPLGKYLDNHRSLPDVIVSVPVSVGSDMHMMGGAEAHSEMNNCDSRRSATPRDVGSPSWEMLPCSHCLQRFDTQRALDSHTRFVHGGTPIF